MIVIGYTADAFGIAAVDHGIAEAQLRGTSVLVINATSAGLRGELPPLPPAHAAGPFAAGALASWTGATHAMICSSVPVKVEGSANGQ